MGAVFSSAGDAVRATKNHEQRRLVAPDAAGADWSGLPEDLLLIVMAALDIPGLVRSGAVCTSWRNACARFRRLSLPSPRQGPCLLYACDEYRHNDAALYCPSTNATFRVPFPGPRHEKRGLVFSSHGWVFATDEVGDPYLLNPITGVQAALPPVKTLPDMENFFDDDGKHVWGPDACDVKNGFPAQIVRARDWAYCRVAISAGDDAAACTVLVMHMWNEMLAFARPSDERWTSLSGVEPLVGSHRRSFSNVLYNDKDGLFYALRYDGSVYTLDLDGPSPVVTKIMRDVTMLDNRAKYLAVAPWGELLQVWRIWNHTHGPVEHHFTYQDAVAMNLVLQDHIDSTSEDDDDKLSEREIDIREDELGDDDNDEPSNREMDKRGLTTTDLLIFKVDVGRQKLVKLRGIGDHALFIGNNSAVCLPTKDFPAFKPNRAYLTDDCHVYGPMLRGDMGIWNFKKRSLQNLGDAWPGDLKPRLDWPAPIWITPSLC